MEQSATLKELCVLVLFLGSLCYVLGGLYQTFVLFRNGALRRNPWGALALVVGSRLVVVLLTLLGWFHWPSSFPQDVMVGPVLLPALLAEAVVSPLALKLAGYKRWAAAAAA